MNFWIFILINLHLVVLVKGLPWKLDLGLVIDTSAAMDSNSIDVAKAFTERLLQHYSISQGTTKVSLVTFAEKSHQLFSFQKHVNREYVLASLKNISCCSDRLVGQKSLTKALQLLEYGRKNNRSKTFVLMGDDSFRISKHKIQRLTVKKGHEISIIIIGKHSQQDIAKTCESPRLGCYALPSFGKIESVQAAIGVPEVNYISCSGFGKVFDECERHCDCIDGILQNCYRVRKEFTQMTKKERQRYLRAYIKLTTEQPFKNKYERFVYMHYKYFCYGIHRKDLFCPWHRFYILQMENLLREIDCRITLPYWDWSFAARDPWNATHLWRHTNDGLGGNGVESRGFCVQTGLFRQGKWYTPFYNDALDIIESTLDLFNDVKEKHVEEDDVVPDLSDCLRRYFYGILPDEAFVKRSLEISADNFQDFDVNLRINYHDAIHNAIGGTMCTHFAATAPEFFLHHSFLDKIWFMWQQRSSAHHNAHFAKSNKKLVGFTHYAKDLIDSHNLPGHVKVTYSKFPERRIEKRENENDEEYIDDNNKPLSSVYHGILETANRNVFPTCNRSKKEKARAQYLYKRFSKNKT